MAEEMKVDKHVIPWEERDRSNYDFDTLVKEIDALVKPGPLKEESKGRSKP